MENKNITVAKHSLLETHLSIIRNKYSSSFLYKSSMRAVANILCLEAIKNLPLDEIEVETPIAKTKAKTISNDCNIIITPILRSGLIISQVLENLLPMAKTYMLGMARNEKTFQPDWYYNKLPSTIENKEKTLVFICDPMLATGGSAHETIQVYIDKGIPQENITFINIISVPEGLNRIFTEFPKIKLITGSIDEKLNEVKYIIPGLGDAGDRYFNTL